ncbi:hypothetical protein ABZ569_32220 [Streptomyces albus]|uniref:hypothetical protein n=1 Tax=Streptomyces albus TaxID=1888 RepID=UPI0033CA3E64
MRTIKHITSAAVITALAASLTACSSSEDAKAPDPRHEAASTAREYQEAVNAHRWKTVCTLKTDRARYGSLRKCIADHDTSTPAPEPTQSSTAPDKAPSYADGSSVPPMADPAPTPRKTGEASLSPVRAGDVVEVPAIGKHPAGYGVEVTFTYAFGNDSPSTERNALRVVKVGKRWRIDQTETVHESDQGHGSPVRTALSRE